MSHPLDGTRPAAKCACGHFAPLGEILESCPRCEDCRRHTGERSPYGGNDADSPAGAEAALREFSLALEQARLDLRAARDAEVTAKALRDKAKRKWTLDPDCPRVARDAYTVAYRDAWVGDKIEAEEDAYQVSVVAREAAAEHLKTLRDQGIIQQSITKSVSQSYQGTGRW